MNRSKALQIVMDAAESWVNELNEYIIPAHENFGQTEEVKAYEKRAEKINEAIFVLMEEEKRDAKETA